MTVVVIIIIIIIIQVKIHLYCIFQYTEQTIFRDTHSLICVKFNTAITFCLLCNSISFYSVALALSLTLNSDLAAAHNWDLLMKLKQHCSSQALDASHLTHSMAMGALALQICLFWIRYDHCDKSGQRRKADWMHCDWMRQIMRKCCRRDASVY